MRTYYIFKIKKEYALLTKNNPYNLYKSLEDMSSLKTGELEIALNFFDQIVDYFDKERLSIRLFKKYKNDYNYTNHLNVHMINDYYSQEKTKLIINSSYMLLRSTKQIPIFLKEFVKKDNIFVCDFKNKDYFWLEQLV